MLKKNENNKSILSLNEKENLNVLLRFILRRLEDDERKTKEDQNLSKLKNLNNYEIVYVPQKNINSEKENEHLEQLLK